MDDQLEHGHDPRYMRALLQELHGEIEHADALSEEERDLLAHVSDDVESYLERTAPGSAERDDSLGARLEEGIATFEITHPTVALAIQRLLDGLSQAGI